MDNNEENINKNDERKENNNNDLIKNLIKYTRETYGITFSDIFNKNHELMGLVALDKLNANEERINAWYKKYVTIEQKIQKGKEFLILNSENWEKYKGNMKYYENYLNFFIHETQNNDQNKIVNNNFL
jgi:hypothetical protein